MDELAPGLHRWTAPHPEWQDGAVADSPADWPRDVGSVLYDAGESVLLIDPLVPDEIWPRLDELVAGRPVAVFTTIGFHERSRDAVAARYDGAPALPDDVRLLEIPRAGETMAWLPRT